MSVTDERYLRNAGWVDVWRVLSRGVRRAVASGRAPEDPSVLPVVDEMSARRARGTGRQRAFVPIALASIAVWSIAGVYMLLRWRDAGDVLALFVGVVGIALALLWLGLLIRHRRRSGVGGS